MSMQELFRLEADGQSQLLTTGLLALERDPREPEHLESCMRAAHSLKGAARLIGQSAAVEVAHAMEDCFVAAQNGTILLGAPQIDLLLAAVDLLVRIAATPEADTSKWAGSNKAEVDDLVTGLGATAIGTPLCGPAAKSDEVAAALLDEPPVDLSAELNPPIGAEQSAGGSQVVRVNAADLNRLMGVAGESLVESRWLKPYADSLLRLKRLHHKTGGLLDKLRDQLEQPPSFERLRALIATLYSTSAEIQQVLGERIGELELFDSRSTDRARRLYDDVLACRMQPFGDGVSNLPKMLRNLARSLGKRVRLDIVGSGTQVDRDILEKLDSTLGHLLRNAVDHGIEPPNERRAAGKPAEGTIRLEARHVAGLLQIIVSDDGRGIDLDRLRQSVLARNLTNAATAAKLTETELLEFLFLPGFSMSASLTTISGRGVGLDVVQTVVKQARGSIRVFSYPGAGVRFQLQLPLTLSVVRSLLVEIGGDVYAFPLAHVARIVNLDQKEKELIEGRQYFRYEGRPVGLVEATQLFGGQSVGPDLDSVSIVVLSEGDTRYGLVVDRFLDECELVVQPLDARLGKIQDIAAGALMKDGSPVLTVDVVDLFRSMDNLWEGGGRGRLHFRIGVTASRRKRVLVVDDSLTVRELQRKLIDQRGYEVETAVDGIDGWNAVRTGHFDLVVTDVDMPRLDGIEMLKLIRKDPHLKSLPVMIVSYKDREDDHRRGLDAGADYYLTKAGFHSETLVQAVTDLIGEASS
jgi:two-component system sensor histidine kinase and response regulator WspE